MFPNHGVSHFKIIIGSSSALLYVTKQGLKRHLEKYLKDTRENHKHHILNLSQQQSLKPEVSTTAQIL